MTDDEIKKLPERMKANIRVIDGEPMYVLVESGKETYFSLDSDFVREMDGAFRIMDENRHVLRRLAQS